MTKLDELSESKEASASSEIPAVFESVRTLLTPTEEGEGFGRQYHDSLQRSPDVVLAHARVKTLLVRFLPHRV